MSEPIKFPFSREIFDKIDMLREETRGLTKHDLSEEQRQRMEELKPFILSEEYDRYQTKLYRRYGVTSVRTFT